jgi:3-hydroxy-D-aspartate aldolase
MEEAMVDGLCRLAARAAITVAVDDARNVADLSAAARAHQVALNVVVEVDAGMGRCGVRPGRPALDLVRTVAAAEGLAFVGLHAYQGHVVQDSDPTVRRLETERMLERTMETRALIERNGIPVRTATCGGTGTYDISGDYPGVTEHQSGSYVYMDPDYRAKVLAFALAFSILSTIMSRPRPDKVITDAGVQSLGNDYGTPQIKNHPELAYGYLSEEHGLFHVRDGGRTALDLGDRVEISPGHCCAAANLHDVVFAVRGGGVEEVWKVTARGRSA